MTDAAFMEERRRRQDQLAADSRVNRKAVMDKLAELGVTLVAVDYDGGCDSGQIEMVRFFTGLDAASKLIEGDDLAPIRAAGISWHDSHTNTWPQPAPTVGQKPLDQAIEALCYDYLSVHHGGWENNEGANGEFAFDVTTGAVTLTHNERYTEYNTTEHDL
jgi:hypothetical protein